jgi:hypothetical protein
VLGDVRQRLGGEEVGREGDRLRQRRPVALRLHRDRHGSAGGRRRERAGEAVLGQRLGIAPWAMAVSSERATASSSRSTPTRWAGCAAGGSSNRSASRSGPRRSSSSSCRRSSSAASSRLRSSSIRALTSRSRRALSTAGRRHRHGGVSGGTVGKRRSVVHERDLRAVVQDAPRERPPVETCGRIRRRSPRLVGPRRARYATEIASAPRRA